ncbi:MAG: PIN domain-containing protein [Solirubrobacteraceae bacterium]
MTRFIDTNILLYAVSVEAEEQSKRDQAVEVLQAVDLALSGQVLAEFYAQATRPSRARHLTHTEAADFLEGLGRFPVHPVTAKLVLAAGRSSQRFQISYWDAAIIEAARALECEAVLSEDMQDGMDFGGVRVENPFAGV